MTKKESVKVTRGGRNPKRTPPELMPKANTRGAELARLPDISDEEDDAAFDAAWDQTFAAEHGKEELERQKAELEKYRAKWNQTK